MRLTLSAGPISVASLPLIYLRTETDPVTEICLALSRWRWTKSKNAVNRSFMYKYNCQNRFEFTREVSRSTCLLRSEVSRSTCLLRSEVARNTCLLRSEVSRSTCLLRSEVSRSTCLLRSEVSRSTFLLRSEVSRSTFLLRSEVCFYVAIHFYAFNCNHFSSHGKWNIHKDPPYPVWQHYANFKSSSSCTN
jgi:hypothetical protein